jgi:hypothetical protein
MISATIPSDNLLKLEQFYNHKVEGHFWILIDVRSDVKKVKEYVEWSIIRTLHVRFSLSVERRSQTLLSSLSNTVI